MRSKFMYAIMILCLLGFSKTTQAQLGSSNTNDTTKMKAGAFVGATSLGGINYQQIGFRGDFPIGKFGFGLDVKVLLDATGKIRKEDWDQWQDYLDKVFYIRYGHRGDPLYIKTGGLDYSYLGYRNIINGYSNMLEYPTVKRYGLEMSVQGDKFGAELFLNDFKEFSMNKPSAVIGGRLTYKLLGDITLGVSAVTDLNQFNGLKDNDKDGYPDEIDFKPYDKNVVTEMDEYIAKGYSQATINERIAKGDLSSTTRSQLSKYGDSTQTVMIYGIDLGYPIIKGDLFKLDVYSHFTKINGYGWGTTLPGARFTIGNFLTILAEYRLQSKEFLFGYFDNTYETQRASFIVDQLTGKKTALTKKESLKSVQSDLNGFFLGADLNLGGWIVGKLYYTDLLKNSEHLRSIRGEVGLKENIIPNVTVAKAFYVQNNVQDFREWKTPSAVAGYALSYNLGGVGMGFEYRYNFVDLNGDGKIRGTNEAVATYSITAGVKF